MAKEPGMSEFDIQKSIASRIHMGTSLDDRTQQRLAELIASVIHANNVRIQQALQKAGIEF